MKKVLSSFLTILMLSLISGISFSQMEGTENDDLYCRANIAYTNFRILRVNETGYVKCVDIINFKDARKVSKRVVIDDVEFLDNGIGNDLRANDGTLTSSTVFQYSSSNTEIEVGKYSDPTNTIIYDDLFEHANKVSTSGELNKIKISCTFSWILCSSWPPDTQNLCREFSWPFNGYFQIKECTVTWEN